MPAYRQRYKRRYRKKRSWRKTRMNRAMTTVKRGENVAFFKKTFNLISQTLTTDYITGFNFKISDIYLEENDIGPLFRFYRLRSVKLRFLFTVNAATGQAASGGQMGWVYILGNQALQATPPTAAYYLNDSKVKIRRLDKLDGASNYSCFYYKLKPVEVNFDSVSSVQTLDNGKNWITWDGVGKDYIHRGVDIYAHPGTGQTGLLDIWATYYFTCKGAR